MKDLELDQYFGITIVTSCRPGSSTILEDGYNGNEGDLQQTGTGIEARFILPKFIISNPVCLMTALEVLDEEGEPFNQMVISMKDMIVKPMDVQTPKQYNFTIKATISGGDFTVTSKKILKVIGNETLLLIA